MPIIATSDSNSQNFEPIAAGAYAARCYSMVHIGTVKGNFEGKEKIQNKVRITWELPTELKVFKEENGMQPHIISKDFTLSMHEKSSLRKWLEGWRGKAFSEDEAKAFDITKLLGVACMVSIIHKTKDGRTYAEVASVSGVPKGMNVPDQITPTFEFTYDSPFDEVKFAKLPQWLRDKMVGSLEYAAAHTNNNGHQPASGLTQEQIDQLESEHYQANISSAEEPADDLPF